MSEPMLAVVARRAVNAIDRKTSLKVIGAAVSMLAVAPLHRAVAKPGKKKKKGNSKCASQRDQCFAFLREITCRPREPSFRTGAEGLEPDASCLEFYTPCCDAFASCDAAAGFPCLTRSREK